MFISADIFIKGMPYLDFNRKYDIRLPGICDLLEADKVTCGACLVYHSGDCMLTTNANPDLQTSIYAFRESHPEYFI